MSQINHENRERILRNPNVARLTGKHIVFTDHFQAEVLRLRAEGYTYAEILKRLGFRASDFNPGYFKSCIKRWRNQEKLRVSGKSKKENRGRPKGSKAKNFETLENLSANDLKSIILVQEEMIKELTKLKALPKSK